MERTWASGILELLRHAESHMGKGYALDNRIAFISVDNAVELTMRTYLNLPRRTARLEGVSRADIAEAAANFTRLLEIVGAAAADRFGSLSPLDVEHYHRIRNTLYHAGTGITIDDEVVRTYFDISTTLLGSLLGVSYSGGVNRLTNLRPDVRQKLKDELRRQKSLQHGELVRKGMAKAVARGARLGRGGPTTGLDAAEVKVVLKLREGKMGYRAIANEINRRRKRSGMHPPRPQITSQAIRKKLVELGLVESTSKPQG